LTTLVEEAEQRQRQRERNDRRMQQQGLNENNIISAAGRARRAHKVRDYKFAEYDKLFDEVPLEASPPWLG